MMDMDHGMGGWGMMGGPGMLAGCGENMMWLGWNAIKLSKEQREKMNAIQRALREKQWVLMDRLHESMQSAGFYRDGKFDEQAARSAYATAEKMHRQMFDNLVEAQGRIDALLTPQQRQQLSQPGQ